MKKLALILSFVLLLTLLGCSKKEADLSTLIAICSGKAQEYIDAGDYDNAIKVLEEGIAATNGSEQLTQMLDGLSQQADASVCLDCGAKLDTSTKFCGACGASVRKSTAAVGEDFFSDISARERADFNRFLMTFVSNGFHPQAESLSDYDMIRFVLYNYIYGEDMTYTNGAPFEYNFTSSADIVAQYVYQLFGRALQHPDSETSMGTDLYYTADGRYHVPAADGEMHTNICVLKNLCLNENGRYDTEFQIYTMSPEVYYDDPDMEVYYALTEEEASQRADLTAGGAVFAEIGRHEADSGETGYYLHSYQFRQ